MLTSKNREQATVKRWHVKFLSKHNSIDDLLDCARLEYSFRVTIDDFTVKSVRLDCHKRTKET